MEIPVETIVTAIAVLCGFIATLLGIFWSFIKIILKKQDKIIANQGDTIKRLQKDIERLSHGCGIDACLWRHRTQSVQISGDLKPRI